MIPLLVFAGFVMFIWALLSMISKRNSRTHERLARLSRPTSAADLDLDGAKKGERFQGFMETAKALSGPLMPQTELEQNQLKVRLANAGFRSDSAVSIYLGLRFGSLIVFFLAAVGIFLPKYGISKDTALPLATRIIFMTAVGFYLPNTILW